LFELIGQLTLVMNAHVPLEFALRRYFWRA